MADILNSDYQSLINKCDDLIRKLLRLCSHYLADYSPDRLFIEPMRTPPGSHGF